MVSAELENALAQMKAVALDALKHLWSDKTAGGYDIQKPRSADVESEKKSFWRFFGN